MGNTARVERPLEAADGKNAAAANAFADCARVIAGIRIVALVPEGDALGVWIVLDGDVTGRVRTAVYDLERTILQQHSEALIDFRVVDAAEYPESRRATLLPTGARPVFDRQPSPVAAAVAGNA